MKRENFKRAKLLRQKSALVRLEAAYDKFKAAKEDKKSWTSTRNGGNRKVFHNGRTYADECKRLTAEIAKLKEKMTVAA